MDYKFLPLSSSKAGFEHGIKKTWGRTMQKAYESYRIDFRWDFFAFTNKLVLYPRIYRLSSTNCKYVWL